MASTVGTKGQVVIAKEIRDQLGIEHGWIAIQRLVGDHVEIHFVPPRHHRSLAGILAPYVKRQVDDTDWAELREQAVMEAVREDWEAYEAEEAQAKREGSS